MLKKTNKYQTLMAICLLTLSACSSNETLPDSPNHQGKTPIELSAGIVGENPTDLRAQTRTVVTTDNPYGHNAAAFDANTSLYMVIKGDKEGSTSKYTRSIGTVASGSPDVSFADGYKRYWEDCYSRASKLSVYSACVPGSSTDLTVGGSNTYNLSSYDWSTTAISPTIAWPLDGTAASQNTTFLTNQDLCFSNNVSNISSDNRMVFNTSTKKFVARQMIFHHALTKVTFKIKRGDGFGTGTGVFNFTNAATENIVLKGFNTSGTLDMSTGEFSSIGTDAINALSLTDHSGETSPAFDYELTGLMLPGSTLTSTATDEVYFTIDNNKYHITKAQLATALASLKLSNGTTDALTTDSKMRPGVHYVFTMTVSKKKIDKLSASIVEWETVNADGMTPSNARITVSLLDNGTPLTGDATFDLYRKASVSDAISDTFVDYTWATGYTDNKANLTENTTSEGVYTAHNSTSDNTIWYWPDNKTYYHFRAVMPKDHTVNSAANDYITLTGAANYTDVCWGAPFYPLSSTTDRLTYSLTTGFDNTGTGDPVTHQIYKAIGPTSDPVRMELFHMMSDVTIQLTTTTDDDKVTLTDATVQLTYIHPTGKVAMGNGLVTPDGTPATVPGTVDGEFKWHYGFVPQSLTDVNGTNDVVLTITTTDGNRYIVDMESVVATTVGNNLIANTYSKDTNNKFIINRWYPNYKYTYTFNLKKSGVETISATLANWESVTADPQTVVIQ
jgi:hypothetical protein